MWKIPLQIADAVKPGRYHLQIDLYNAQHGGIHLLVYDDEGVVLPDAQIILTELEVVP